MARSQEGKGQAEEQKHDRGRVEGEDGCAAAEGREQLKEVRHSEQHNLYPPISEKSLLLHIEQLFFPV